MSVRVPEDNADAEAPGEDLLDCGPVCCVAVGADVGAFPAAAWDLERVRASLQQRDPRRCMGEHLDYHPRGVLHRSAAGIDPELPVYDRVFPAANCAPG